MSMHEHDRRRRRRLLLLLLLLLLSAVLGLWLVGREDAGSGAAGSEPASSAAPAPPGSTEAAPTDSASSAGSTRKPRKHAAPSAVEPDAPARPAAASPSDDAGGPPPAVNGDEGAPDSGGGSGVPFRITGAVRDLRVGAWTSIPLAIDNPNHVDITVTDLRVAVSGNPNGCDALTNFETRSSTEAFTVPAEARGYPVPFANRPWIRLRSLGANQNRCKRQTITLSFGGSATGS